MSLTGSTGSLRVRVGRRSVPYTGLFRVIRDGSPVSVFTGPRYAAFPGVAILPENKLLVTARTGSDHFSADGHPVERVVDLSTSEPTLSAEQAVLDDPSSIDMRHAVLWRLPDGRVVMGYFLVQDGSVEGSTPLQNARVVIRETNGIWGTPRQVTHDFTSVALNTNSICVAADSSWLFCIYGRDSSDASSVVDVRIYRSVDEGLSWTPAHRFHEAQSFGETALVLLPSGRLVALLRQNSNKDTWRAFSDDNGATFTTPVRIVTGRWGAPIFMRHSSGVLITFLRADISATVGLRTEVWFSRDDGITWARGPELMTGNGSVYNQGVELSDGRVAVAYAVEYNRAQGTGTGWAAVYLQVLRVEGT